MYAEIFRLTALDKTNYKDLETISGETPPIFKEIWIFPNLNGIFPLIFQIQFSHSLIFKKYFTDVILCNLVLKYTNSYRTIPNF
jgi:hypothetical protein